MNAEQLAWLRLNLIGDAHVQETAAILASGEGPVAAVAALEALGYEKGLLGAAETLRDAEKAGLRFVAPGDEEWPAQLDDLKADRPLGLWVKGNASLRTVRGVAVVGSRAATTYGADVAADISCNLVAEGGYAVVSGAAFGIDQAAHRGALAGDGLTVAVLACGADRYYPAAHRQLIDAIGDRGLIVSEQPPGAIPTRLRFLARNRIIAALTQGTVIVESATRSGSLNTAGWATKLGRPLMAVPGPVTSASSVGTNTLIRIGQAKLVTSGRDVAQVLSEGES